VLKVVLFRDTLYLYLLYFVLNEISRTYYIHVLKYVLKYVGKYKRKYVLIKNIDIFTSKNVPKIFYYILLL